MTEQPVVTVVLYAFQERQYVEEAVASLLSQDYPNLEIVLSDDGSTDGTFDVMRRMAAEYAGPHRVFLYQNAKNTGICSQINAGLNLSSGELILLANADDRSRPNRVSRTVEAWLGDRRRASVVVSPLQVIDRNGALLPGQFISSDRSYSSLPEAVKARCVGVGSAASVALRRDVFAEFSSLMPRLMLEDNPLFMRAMICGEVLCLDDALVEYRIHGENISQAYELADYEEWKARFDKRVLWQRGEAAKAYTQMLFDLYSSRADQLPVEVLEESRFGAACGILENELYRQFYDRKSTLKHVDRWRALSQLALTLGKLTVKQLVPALEERAVRKNYAMNVKRQGNGQS